jgi:hypothetical protein
MSDASKDTIYVDVDEEITGIIDKVRSSDHKLVALVLPKRASVFQSIVNMKLLKRTADNEKKNVVLITSEAGLLPLAGSVGLYVAKTLQTKPTLPNAPDAYDDTDAIDEPVDVESEPSDFNPKEVADKPVGELAGLGAADAAANESKPSSLDPDETINLNEDEIAAAGTIAESRADAKKSKKNKKKDKKDKKLKIPDFIKFRRVLIIGVLALILIIIGLVMLVKILPKATVDVQTSNSDITSNLSLALSTSAKTLDPTNLVVPATSQQVSKTNSQQVPTTGQKNNGAQATGQVTLSLTNCSQQQVTIPSGTGISANGMTFLTQSAANLQSVQVGKSCNPSQFSNIWSTTVNVNAQTGGSQYNISPTSFTVAGFSGVQGQSSTAFSGGTDSIIKIVAQADVDSANQKIAAQDTTAIKQQLQTQLQQAGLTPITSTYAAGTPTVSTTPAVGSQADNVTVSQTVNYTMLGVHQSDLKTLVDNNVDKQINSSQQQILSDGVSNATFTVQNQSGGQTQVAMQATSTVGSQFSVPAIKKQIVGKKSGDVQTIIKAYPGVQTVTTHFSPFWVSSVPSNTSKITINVLKQSGS